MIIYMTKEHNVIWEKEFQQLFVDRYLQLYYIAYDYVREEEEAKDIVAEVFANIWNRRTMIDPQTINAYLFSCIRNRCIDHLKRKKNLAILLKEYPLLFTESGDNEWEEREWSIEKMQIEIKNMPIRVQQVLHERYINNKSYKEIAEMLDISTHGVGKIITRAFAHLRSVCKPTQ